MPQPTPYAPDFAFSDFQAANPSAPLPGYRLDAELNHLGDTLSGVLGNLVLIQRDDGKLADGAVTVDAVTDELLQAIADAVPGTPPQPVFTIVVTTLAPGAPATAALSGVYPNLQIDLGIPKGDAGTSGASVATGDYGDVAVTGAGSVWTVQTVGGVVPSFPGDVHPISTITGLQAALDAKQSTLTFGHANDTDALKKADGDILYQSAGSYATPSQLAAKADLLTTINSFSVNQNVSDATHNGKYNKMTGGTTRTITFGSTPSDGHCSIWVNRGTVDMTIACAGGYYKDGASAPATANFALSPGHKLTAFHEGSGVYTFDVI